MKKLINFLFAILGLATSIEVLLIPATLLINHREPEIINEKVFLLWDALAFIITCILGSILIKLTKPKQNENRNRK